MASSQPSLWANIPVIEFKPVRFIPAASEATIKDMEVSRFFAVAHKIESEHTTGAGTTNHWCFYVQSTTNDWIRIDAVPSGLPGPRNVGSKANIVISHLPCTRLPDSVEHHNEIKLQQSITVRWIVDTIVDAGHHKFEYNAEGVGCRKWVVDQLAVLASALNGSDVETVNDDICMLWPERTPLPMSTGAGYYD